MSLDKNLFTLLFTPHKNHPNVIDLVDPSGTVHYRKQRVPNAEYKIEVYDPMSESLLVTATAPSAASKAKTLELCNPTSVVELRYTGTLSFKWGFKWEDHEFEWKREECFMIRKPDPPVIIAVTKESTGRLKSTTVQILDYNLNRFDISDRKGLEIVILTALMTFHDANEAHHSPEAGPQSPATVNPLTRVVTAVTSSSDPPPPPPPPKPAPKTGVARVAELQAIRGEYNEIIISEEGSIQDYAEYCNKMLQDDAMLFITVKSADAEQVPKVLQVVEETKRIRYKAGLSEDEELHQYVLYDTQEARKGPRRINLDDDAKNKYTPPKNLTVHLSKISMPELQPKALANEKSQKDSRKDKKAATSKPARPAPTPATPGSSAPQQPNLKPQSNRLQRPSRPVSPNPPQVQSHQVRPSQPAPSQNNNPSVYTSPPPQSSRPTSSYHQRATSATGPSWAQPNSHGGQLSISTNAGPYPSSTSNFPPTNWGAQAPPSQDHQPQPVAGQDTTTSSSKPLTASTVVHGLMDLLSHRR